MLTKIIIALLALAVVAAGGAIIKNNVPLLESPGLVKRLMTYLTRNTARTAPDHPLPELRTRSYAVPPDRLFERVRSAASERGWRIAGADPAERRLHAVVSTPWLRFEDDVHIALEESADGKTRLNVTSRSRLGRADYGANISHIMSLYGALDTGS